MIGITQEEFDRLQALKPAVSYTQEEVEFLLDITQRKVDINQRVCFTCSSSISDLKQTLYSWFNENEQIIIDELLAASQATQYTNGQ